MKVIAIASMILVSIFCLPDRVRAGEVVAAGTNTPMAAAEAVSTSPEAFGVKLQASNDARQRGTLVGKHKYVGKKCDSLSDKQVIDLGRSVQREAMNFCHRFNSLGTDLECWPYMNVNYGDDQGECRGSLRIRFLPKEKR